MISTTNAMSSWWWVASWGRGVDPACWLRPKAKTMRPLGGNRDFIIPSAPRPFWECILGRFLGSKYILKRYLEHQGMVNAKWNSETCTIRSIMHINYVHWSSYKTKQMYVSIFKFTYTYIHVVYTTYISPWGSYMRHTYWCMTIGLVCCPATTDGVGLLLISWIDRKWLASWYCWWFRNPETSLFVCIYLFVYIYIYMYTLR